MRSNHMNLALTCVIAVCSFGCSSPEFSGAMAQIIVGGLTGDEVLAAKAGQEARAAAEQDQQRQFLLSKLPPGWLCPEGQIYYSEEAGCMIYSRPDQSWVKWQGGQWIEGE